MKQVKVLGSGCAKCSKTAEMIADISEEMGVDAIVKKDTDPQTLLKFKVMKTPAVVIDGELIHSGSVPTRDEIEGWLRD
ncbi:MULTISPECIES: thioredoxin family protein [Shewanella]|jgi:small redox-active disulfide protein 2|uniref:Redox-active disulfide protein 2 n=1 Tax=Shewanella baltica (strain OS195) TaxID=399599 RepID=A9L4K1_SHEB9|nr:MULTISPECIES: thioredoxin family protein [Shewanella]ABS09955.1 redox-active disulfide protein 2 [Shewanella baltica OS185]ABX51117.1 redox-active disulfide protein 2 [Shewanella baltica OS195]ADT96118.1 redox-active disulfide protein 2 [Shewanella baltica OS678]AEG12979.1 redox-active disulfide protein 2 [Shewanella baltica BA175]AVT48161.1 thioredoxin family protein [Shewanella baltica]